MNIQRSLGKRLARMLPKPARRALALELCERERETIVDMLGRCIKRDAPDLDHLPLDLPIHRDLSFEHLAGLFANTSLDEGIVSMNVRQAAYLFGLIRQMEPGKVIEIGRGGTTVVIAAAMNGRGQFWSIDVAGFDPPRRSRITRPLAAQIGDFCKKLGLHVEILVGDSRTIDVETGEVDLVFIDGDHSYEMARSDFERFGKRVRLNGAVLFDDAFDDGFVRSPHTEPVGRVVREIDAEGHFRLVKVVKRLAQLERIR